MISRSVGWNVTTQFLQRNWQTWQQIFTSQERKECDMWQVFFSYHQDKSIYCSLTISEQILCSFQQTFTNTFYYVENLFWIKALPELEWMYDQLHLLEHIFEIWHPFRLFKTILYSLNFTSCFKSTLWL